MKSTVPKCDDDSLDATALFGSYKLSREVLVSGQDTTHLGGADPQIPARPPAALLHGNARLASMFFAFRRGAFERFRQLGQSDKRSDEQVNLTRHSNESVQFVMAPRFGIVENCTVPAIAGCAK